MTDEESVEHLNTLLGLMRTHGSRADEVRRYIKGVGSTKFESLALALVLLFESRDLLDEMVNEGL
jgi:hypothetical protein